MEPEGLLPLLQEAAICPYPEPGQSKACPTNRFLEDPVECYVPSVLLSSKWHPSFCTKTLYASLLFPSRATRTAHLMFLGLITQAMFDGDYITCVSLLCGCLQSFVTLPLSGYFFVQGTQVASFSWRLS